MSGIQLFLCKSLFYNYLSQEENKINEDQGSRIKNLIYLYIYKLVKTKVK